MHKTVEVILLFSDNYVNLCVKHGKHVTTVAEELGFSRNSGRKWADGSVPRKTTVKRIADYFGVTVEELLSDKKEKPAPGTGNGLSEKDARLLSAYHKASAEDRQIIDIIISKYVSNVVEIAPRKKTITLFPTSAAAGHGEPDTGNPFEEYEVDADSRAEFAVRVSGDSMEPVLHDGQIALCTKRRPDIGDVVVVMINGSLLVKQFITDGENIYLRSINRARKDCDYDIWASGNDSVRCYGTVLLPKRPALVDQ